MFDLVLVWYVPILTDTPLLVRRGQFHEPSSEVKHSAAGVTSSAWIAWSVTMHSMSNGGEQDEKGPVGTNMVPNPFALPLAGT